MMDVRQSTHVAADSNYSRVMERRHPHPCSHWLTIPADGPRDASLLFSRRDSAANRGHSHWGACISFRILFLQTGFFYKYRLNKWSFWNLIQHSFPACPFPFPGFFPAYQEEEKTFDWSNEWLACGCVCFRSNQLSYISPGGFISTKDKKIDIKNFPKAVAVFLRTYY